MLRRVGFFCRNGLVQKELVESVLGNHYLTLIKEAEVITVSVVIGETAQRLLAQPDATVQQIINKISNNNDNNNNNNNTSLRAFSYGINVSPTEILSDVYGTADDDNGERMLELNVIAEGSENDSSILPLTLIFKESENGPTKKEDIFVLEGTSKEVLDHYAHYIFQVSYETEFTTIATVIFEGEEVQGELSTDMMIGITTIVFIPEM